MIYLDELWNADSAQSVVPARGNANPASAASTLVTGLAAMVSDQHPHEIIPELPDDLASIDDAFLDRVRALASFI